MKIKTGIGLDVHSFASGKDFYLGGIKIKHEFGLEGHSDADALIHAIMDSLLGAAGLNDIGTFFPDNDPKYKNIRSTILLEEVKIFIDDNNFKIGNIDTIICLEAPKINSYVEQMRKTISDILKIDFSDITIKATTFEKMGFIGNKQGILCMSNCILYKS